MVRLFRTTICVALIVVNRLAASQVLSKRPDIWIALKTMKAENVRIGAARTNLCPDIALSANVCYQGKSFKNLFTPQGFSWTIAGNLLQPVFNYGRNRALVDTAFARYLYRSIPADSPDSF